jgi:hypothetical protein
MDISTRRAPRSALSPACVPSCVRARVRAWCDACDNCRRCAMSRAPSPSAAPCGSSAGDLRRKSPTRPVGSPLARPLVLSYDGFGEDGAFVFFAASKHPPVRVRACVRARAGACVRVRAHASRACVRVPDARQQGWESAVRAVRMETWSIGKAFVRVGTPRPTRRWLRAMRARTHTRAHAHNHARTHIHARTRTARKTE